MIHIDPIGWYISYDTYHPIIEPYHFYYYFKGRMCIHWGSCDCVLSKAIEASLVAWNLSRKAPEASVEASAVVSISDVKSYKKYIKWLFFQSKID